MLVSCHIAYWADMLPPAPHTAFNYERGGPLLLCMLLATSKRSDLWQRLKSGGRWGNAKQTCLDCSRPHLQPASTAHIKHPTQFSVSSSLSAFLALSSTFHLASLPVSSFERVQLPSFVYCSPSYGRAPVMHVCLTACVGAMLVKVY